MVRRYLHRQHRLLWPFDGLHLMRWIHAPLLDVVVGDSVSFVEESVSVAG